MLLWSLLHGMDPSSYCPFHWLKVADGGVLIYHVSQVGAVLSMRPAGEVHTRVFPALSDMVIWQLDPSELTVQLPPAIWIPLNPSVELDRVKVMESFPHPADGGFQLPQEGSILSILAVGDVQVRVFPALSRMVTLHVPPLVLTVQLPHSTSIPLQPVSVELDRVKVTFPELQEVPFGLHDPHVGSVSSAGGGAA